MIRRSVMLTLLLWLWLPAAGAAELPSWRELEYSASYLWLTARAKLALEPVRSAAAARDWLQPGADTRPLQPTSDTVWLLQVDNQLDNQSESIRAWLDPATLAAYERQRTSAGKDQRMKRYRQLAGGILRQRLEPAAGEQGLPPQRWTRRQQQLIQKPPAVPPRVTASSPYGLLVAAGDPALSRIGDTRKLLLFTDLDYLQATLEVTGREALAVDYTRDGRPERGEIDALVIRLSIQPAEGQLHDEFSLLGLAGDIRILVDSASRLPVQVRGNAPRLGKTSLSLHSARTRPPPAGPAQ